MEQAADYVSFTLHETATDSLRMVDSQLARIPEDSYAWRWVIIALHQTYHGFICLALRRTDGAQLLSREAERQTYERWDRERQLGHPIPDTEMPYVDFFLSLYGKLKDPKRMATYDDSQPLVATSDQDASVEFLNRTRNDFSHYTNVTQVFAVPELVKTVRDSIDVIEFLLNESGNVELFEHGADDRARETIARIRIQLDRIEPIVVS
jgi:hypothetical protein